MNSRLSLIGALAFGLFLQPVPDFAVRSGPIHLINLDAASAPALVATAKAEGVEVVAGNADKPQGTPLVIWEATGDAGKDITPAQAAALGEYVRQGGSLLLTIGANPGSGPFRLEFMLPTTAWRTQLHNANRGTDFGPIASGECDTSFFPGGAPAVGVPFYFPLRPVDSAERGQARYERYAATIPYINLPVPAGNDFWTRPLINRDWQIRLRAADGGHSGLLLTGRYGAGRVAVFGSSAALDAAHSAGLWKPTLQWLLAGEASMATAPVAASFPAPTVAVDRAARSLNVGLTNPTATAVHGTLVARLLTWEGAFIADVEQPVNLPANGPSNVSVAVPALSDTGFQALQFRDAYKVRVGLLSADGSTVLAQTEADADFRPVLRVAVSTDDLRQIPYPYAAPGPDLMEFPKRLGVPVAAYAYKPGSTANVTVTVANGAINLAPLSTVTDLTQPNNPTVPALTDDAAQAEKKPGDTVQANGCWIGSGQDNNLQFVFPHPVTLAVVEMWGAPDNYRKYLGHNPGAASLDIDGHEVASAKGIDVLFVKNSGRVRLEFAPVSGTTVVLHLPVAPGADGVMRHGPWLGEVRLEGWDGPVGNSASGTVSLALRDALSGAVTPVGSQKLDVPFATSRSTTLAVSLPKDAADHLRVLSLEATFAPATGAPSTGTAPLITIDPLHPLQDIDSLRPDDAPSLGFIVTRGFKNVFPIGTGTQEDTGGWATPDDLVWAYSRQLKQLGPDSATEAGKLFVTDSDLRHYSTPWRSFDDGEPFYQVATPSIIDKMKAEPTWAASNLAILEHSDRWDTGPSTSLLNGWQDFEQFDEYLRDSGGPGLKGRTKAEIVAEIAATYESQWQAWNLQRYLQSIADIKNGFAAQGHQVTITAQGMPLLPIEAAPKVAEVVRGMSDDNTWGMDHEDIPYTTGRQMGALAVDPVWAMSNEMVYGYDSAVLNDPHWHGPVSTTEPALRHLYDRAWRGVVKLDGTYQSMHTYGWSENAGSAYTDGENDFNQWWRVMQRNALIAPEGPLGVGLVLSTTRMSEPGHVTFSGSAQGAQDFIDTGANLVQNAVGRLQPAGVAVSFSTNAAALAAWKGDAPLIVMNLSAWSNAEIAPLAALHARGVHIAAFSNGDPLPAAAASLFGVKPDGTPASGQAVGTVAGHPMVQGAGTLYLPISPADLTNPGAIALAPQLLAALEQPLTFPTGTAGYGFTSGGQKFVVVEDWMEQGRDVLLKVAARPGATIAHAANLNDHAALDVTREGENWVIHLPLRPGEGVLVCLDES